MLFRSPANLRAGAQYFFIGQRGFTGLLETLVGGAEQYHSRDVRLLALMDDLPSFDPFLMRERMRQHGFRSAGCYFQVSDADMRRMFAFVQEELKPLVTVSFGGDVDFVGHTATLAAKLLASSLDADLEPLRETLKLTHRDFEEGVFCWKGFLYYKWNLTDSLAQVRGVLDEITHTRPRGFSDEDTRQSIADSRRRIREAVHAAIETVHHSIGVYQSAFANLSQHGKPVAFRDFLLDAPSLFTQLGERLGAINHITSFWRFRFPHGVSVGVSAEELADIFADFETSLNFRDTGRSASRLLPGSSAAA